MNSRPKYSCWVLVFPFSKWVHVSTTVFHVEIGLRCRYILHPDVWKHTGIGRTHHVLADQIDAMFFVTIVSKIWHWIRDIWTHLDDDAIRLCPANLNSSSNIQDSNSATAWTGSAIGGYIVSELHVHNAWCFKIRKDLTWLVALQNNHPLYARDISQHTQDWPRDAQDHLCSARMDGLSEKISSNIKYCLITGETKDFTICQLFPQFVCGICSWTFVRRCNSKAAIHSHVHKTIYGLICRRYKVVSSVDPVSKILAYTIWCPYPSMSLRLENNDLLEFPPASLRLCPILQVDAVSQRTK